MKYDLFLNFFLGTINATREYELHSCLKKNLNNQYINKIIIPESSRVIFSEFADLKIAHQGKVSELKNWEDRIEFLDVKSSEDILIPDGGTFWNFSDICEGYLDNGGQNRLIISNSDIEFNETLKIADDFDLNTTALSLSAWNVEGFSLTFIYPKPFDLACSSQDCWIIKPARKIKDIKVPIGTHLCESRIANSFKQVGLKTVNPSYSIITRHIHQNHNPKSTHERFRATFENMARTHPHLIAEILENTCLIPPTCTSLTKEYNACFRSEHHGIRAHSFNSK
jgi:hypothetical protein